MLVHVCVCVAARTRTFRSAWICKELECVNLRLSHCANCIIIASGGGECSRLDLAAQQKKRTVEGRERALLEGIGELEGWGGGVWRGLEGV